MPHRITFLTIAAVALTAAACRQDDLTSPSTPEPVTSAPAKVVATVELERGGTITFLDLGGGEIGISELAPAREEFVSLSMIEGQQASPLEVYLALRPVEADVPERLVRDHERVAMARSTSPTPRLLAPPAAARSPLTNPGHGTYTCDALGTQWVADWKAAFAGVTKYREATYNHNYSAPYKFYPGAAVFHGTNTNSKTYLGACNGDEDHELRLEIHRWIGGSWQWFLTAGIAAGSKYTFYSGIPAGYRGKAYGMGGETVEHYGVGAAWTMTPGKRTP